MACRCARSPTTAPAGPDGLARFLDRGTWFADAHYGHAFTVTAAGHATMLTGAYPHRTGIIGNDWLDAATGADVYNTGDTTATYTATPPSRWTAPARAISRWKPWAMCCAARTRRSKVIGVSGKDRGAILPAGKAGTAYMYMSPSRAVCIHHLLHEGAPGLGATAFNAAKPADRFFKQEWKRCARRPPTRARCRQPALVRPRGGQAADDPDGGGRTTSRARRSTASCCAALRRPADAGLRTRGACRRAAGPGRRPDILSISLSGHDYVNHAYSAESRLSHDHLLQLDRMLQAFFRDLDATVGADNYIAVLTADHGFMPSPEVSRLRGLDAGFVSSTPDAAGRERRAGAALRCHAAGAVHCRARRLVLDRKLIADKGLDADTVAAAARDQLLTQPGFAVAYTRRELSTGSRAGAPHFDAMRRSWHEPVSGDVQYALKPNWMFRSSSSNTTHGSPHPYDTHVPILLWGPAWVQPGRVDSRVEVADIAPTLARLLGVAVPAAAEGRVLPLPR
jgi:hypothetical protein